MWVIELGVIEDVEELSPELQTRRFRDARGFHQPEISVYDTWAVKELPVRRAEAAQLPGGERVGKEKGVWSIRTGLACVLRPYLSNQVRYIGVAASHKRQVLSLAQVD